MPTNPTPARPDLARVEWAFWSAITTGLLLLHFTIDQRAGPAAGGASPPALAWIGLVPLVLSAAVRWLVLSRFSDPQKRFPLFVAGIALAEGCGLLGIFLAGPQRETLVLLSLIGLAQFLPALLPRSERRASSFR